MPLLNEMRAVTRRLQMAGDGLRRALDPGRSASRRCAGSKRAARDRAVSVSTVPLDLAPILREDLFKRAATTVVTSATLATDGRFDFLAARLGLDDPELEPRDGNLSRRRSSIASRPSLPCRAMCRRRTSTRRAISARSRASRSTSPTAADGGMFVLFTSHRDVRAMAAELRARGVGASVAAARAWRRDARRAARTGFATRASASCSARRRSGKASTCRATRCARCSSPSCRSACRPSRSPPRTAKRSAARGGDSFREYMLPHAALRLKQGFGRLIRTSADRGVVVIADPRVVTKSVRSRAASRDCRRRRRIVGRWSDTLISRSLDVARNRLSLYSAPFNPRP